MHRHSLVVSLRKPVDFEFVYTCDNLNAGRWTWAKQDAVVLLGADSTICMSAAMSFAVCGRHNNVPDSYIHV